jgi:hypothetical protein
MRLRASLLIPLAMALPAVCEAQAVHKCIDDGVVAYQSAPCAGRQVDAGPLPLPGYADPAQRDGAAAPRTADAPAAEPVEAPMPPALLPAGPDVQDAFPFETSIALGMTDDQVLNIADWGRPTRIARSGRHRGWREVWTYERAADTRQLSFVDGRLARIDRGTTSMQLASAAQ